jgi:hypothetical protein
VKVNAQNIRRFAKTFESHLAAKCISSARQILKRLAASRALPKPQWEIVAQAARLVGKHRGTIKRLIDEESGIRVKRLNRNVFVEMQSLRAHLYRARIRRSDKPSRPETRKEVEEKFK